MYSNHAKAIKGLSIANIVLASLGLLLTIACWILMAIGGAAVMGSAGYIDYSTSSVSQGDILAIFGTFSGLLILVFAFALVVLIAGIMGVRNASHPEKLTSVMVWNIIGAVSYIIGVGWVGVAFAVLCIVVAIFSYQDKKAFTAGTYYGAPVYGGMAQNSMPMPGQSGAPVASQASAPVTGQFSVQATSQVAPQTAATNYSAPTATAATQAQTQTQTASASAPQAGTIPFPVEPIPAAEPITPASQQDAQASSVPVSVVEVVETDVYTSADGSTVEVVEADTVITEETTRAEENTK